MGRRDFFHEPSFVGYPLTAVGTNLQIPFTTQLRGPGVGKLISSWYFLELYMFLVEMQQKFSGDITHLQKSFVFLPPKVYDAMKQCPRNYGH